MRSAVEEEASRDEELRLVSFLRLLIFSGILSVRVGADFNKLSQFSTSLPTLK